MCVCCFSPLSLHLFTFNKGFVWTVTDSFCQNKDIFILQINTQALTKHAFIKG